MDVVELIFWFFVGLLFGVMLALMFGVGGRRRH